VDSRPARRLTRQSDVVPRPAQTEASCSKNNEVPRPVQSMVTRRSDLSAATPAPATGPLPSPHMICEVPSDEIPLAPEGSSWKTFYKKDSQRQQMEAGATSANKKQTEYDKHHPALCFKMQIVWTTVSTSQQELRRHKGTVWGWCMSPISRRLYDPTIIEKSLLKKWGSMSLSELKANDKFLARQLLEICNGKTNSQYHLDEVDDITPSLYGVKQGDEKAWKFLRLWYRNKLIITFNETTNTFGVKISTELNTPFLTSSHQQTLLTRFQRIRKKSIYVWIGNSLTVHNRSEIHMCKNNEHVEVFRNEDGTIRKKKRIEVEHAKSLVARDERVLSITPPHMREFLRQRSHFSRTRWLMKGAVRPEPEVLNNTWGPLRPQNLSSVLCFRDSGHLNSIWRIIILSSLENKRHDNDEGDTEVDHTSTFSL